MTSPQDTTYPEPVVEHTATDDEIDRCGQRRRSRIVRFPKRAPAPVAELSFARDRAAVVTTAILQIVTHALIGWFCHEVADLAGGRSAIEAILRDEFEAVARQTLNEIRREDG